MFSLDTAIDIMFKTEIITCVKEIISEGFAAPHFINQKMPIYTLRDNIQKFVIKSYVNIVQEYYTKEKRYCRKIKKRSFQRDLL